MAQIMDKKFSPCVSTLLTILAWNCAKLTCFASSQFPIDIIVPGYSSPYWPPPSQLSPDLRKTEPAFRTGLNYLRATYPRFNWTLQYVQSKDVFECDNVQFMLSRWYYNRTADSGLPVIVAPGCFESTYLNHLAAAWDILLITELDYKPGMHNRELYPTFLTTSPITPNIGLVYCSLFGKLKWSKLYMLYDRNSPPYYMVQATANMDFMKTICPSVQVTGNEFSSLESSSVVASKLREFDSKSRVLIYFGTSFGLRKIMEVAHQLKMTQGEHVYLGLRPYDSPALGLPATWQPSSSDSQAIRDAYRSVLLVTFIDESLYTTNTMKRLVEEWVNITLEGDIPKNRSAVNELNLLVLIAVETALEMVGMMLNDSHASNTLESSVIPSGKALANRLLNHTFNLRTGRIRMMTTAQVSHRQFVYTFDSLANAYQLFLRSESDLQTDEFIFSRVGNGLWFGGDTLPPDEPHCGFDGNREECQTFSSRMKGYLAGGTTVSCLIVLGLIGFVLSRVRQAQRLLELWWMLEENLLACTRAAQRQQQKSRYFQRLVFPNIA